MNTSNLTRRRHKGIKKITDNYSFERKISNDGSYLSGKDNKNNLFKPRSFFFAFSLLILIPL